MTRELAWVRDGRSPQDARFNKAAADDSSGGPTTPCAGMGEPPRTELGWLGEMLGGARDLDVQIKYFKEELTALDLPDRRGFGKICRASLHGARQSSRRSWVNYSRHDTSNWFVN